MPRGVARAMAHLKRVRPQGHCVAVSQPARGRERPRWGKAIACCSVFQAINPKLVARVRPNDGQLQLVSQLSRATCVVDVGMRDPNDHQLHAKLLASALQHIEVAAWVDNRRGHALVLPNHRAVLLKWRDGDGFVVEHSGDIM